MFVAAGAASGAAVGAQRARPAKEHETGAPRGRHLLASRAEPDRIRTSLLPRESWKPFPVASERPGWDSLSPAIRSSLVRAGEKSLEGSWPIPKATLLLEFVRTGNRSNYERELSQRRTRLRDLVLAECAEGKGRFLDEIGNGVWSICEETWWGYPAHLGQQREGAGLPDVTEPIIDLFAAEAAALLAWTHYLLAPQLEKVHKLIPQRIAIEIDRRVLVPYQSRTDFGWMGFDSPRPVNNWNPWINSNCLACNLLMQSDPAKRAEMTHKVIRSLDRFMDGYTDDGGCDEGPSYWGRAGASLFDNLELLHSATNGRIDFYSLPLVKEIGRYIYRVNIADDWYVNFADASARVTIAGDLTYRYGKRIADDKMQMLGAHVATSAGVNADSIGRFLPALFNRAEIEKAAAGQPLVRDAWFPGIQVMTARVKEGSADGLYLAAQGGHNAESHNHNDVGNFIIYAAGKPAIIDVGVETYSAKTFSSKRYEIWTMQSAYHNLPTVNGVMQAPGRNFEARNVSYKSDDAGAEIALDIAAAYPPDAEIETWHRTLRLDRRQNRVEIRDAYLLRKAGGRIEWTLMTPCEVQLSSPGKLTLTGGFLGSSGVTVTYPGALAVAVEEVNTPDPRLKGVWGPRVRRVLLRAQDLAEKGEVVIQVTQF
jgi:hypothetical protein